MSVSLRLCYLQRLVFLAACVAPCFESAAEEARPPAKVKKVLLIGIDGCRFDAVREAEAPNLDKLAAAGALDDETLILGDRYRMNDTISGPGWSSILTGVWADKHGVQDNKFREPKLTEYPHFFRRIKGARASAYTISLVDWAPIHSYIVAAADVALTFPETEHYVTGDDQIAGMGARLLREADPAATFVYFGQVDEAGHNYGFDPAVEPYRRAIERVDGHLGTVLAAVDERKTRHAEDWLVLVTSDHGGKGKGHGDGHNEPEILHSFLIVSGPSATRGELKGPTYLVDVVPTILAHLGVPADPAWGLDGRPVGLRPE